MRRKHPILGTIALVLLSFTGCVTEEGDGLNTTNSTFVDARDGRTYKYVVIGTQTWMAENLDYGVQIPGDSDQANDNLAEKYCFKDDSNSCKSTGGLYQWTEAMALPYAQCIKSSCSSLIAEKHKGLCPKGWHIPSKSDWMTLETYIGMTPEEVKRIGFRGEAAPKLMAAPPVWWGSSIQPTDSFGFSLIPSGDRFPSSTPFSSTSPSADLWSTEENYGGAYPRNFTVNNTSIGYTISLKNNGYSIRCIKD